MDEITIVRLAELRSKIGAIPGKLLVTILFMEVMFWHFSWDAFTENIAGSLGVTVVMYGLISYVWLCVRLTHNWLVGIVFAIILFFIFMINIDKMGDTASAIITIAICFGGPILDVLNIIRYFMLKRKIKRGASDGYAYYDAYDENNADEAEDYEEEENNRTASGSPVFFSGCNNEGSIKRRYKELCKVYHPDSGNGSAEVFARITDEYNRLIAQYDN